MRAVSFVSLGPNCVAAEILRSSSLRTCTFGFDWLRSGCNHIEDFFRLDFDTFVADHVSSPNIKLIQPLDPSQVVGCTSEPQLIRPLYGYPYLYTPHRSYQNPLTNEYLKRSFLRLHDVINDSTVYKIFLLADYCNKPYAVHFDQYVDISNHLTNLFSGQIRKDTFNIFVLRIKLVDWSQYGYGFRCKKIEATGAQVDVIFELDEPTLRRFTYRLIGNTILRPLCHGIPLWSPD